MSKMRNDEKATLSILYLIHFHGNKRVTEDYKTSASQPISTKDITLFMKIEFTFKSKLMLKTESSSVTFK